VEVDGADQTEVWATFRAARLARPIVVRAVEEDGRVEVTASHDGYVRLRGRPVHQRTWRVYDGRIEVIDEITGSGPHRASSAMHLAPGTTAAVGGPNAVEAGALRIEVSADGPVVVELVEPGTAPDGLVATGFGLLAPAPAVLARLRGTLPLRLETAITYAPGGALSGDAYHHPAVARHS
jgi:hypothetical protein